MAQTVRITAVNTTGRPAPSTRKLQAVTAMRNVLHLKFCSRFASPSRPPSFPGLFFPNTLLLHSVTIDNSTCCECPGVGSKDAHDEAQGKEWRGDLVAARWRRGRPGPSSFSLVRSTSGANCLAAHDPFHNTLIDPCKGSNQMDACCRGRAGSRAAGPRRRPAARFRRFQSNRIAMYTQAAGRPTSSGPGRQPTAPAAAPALR